VVLTITCPQLIATSEYFKLAYKWYGSGFSQFPHTVPIDVFISSSIHVSDLSTLFSGKRVSAVDYGTLFITRVGFLLGVLAVVAMMKENSTHKKVVVAALGVCAFGLSFAFSKFICFSYVYSHMPILNLVRSPARGLFAFAFGGSILAAVGIDTLRLFVSKRVGGLPKNKANLVIIFLTIGLLFLMLVEVRYWVVERVERPLSGINSAFESTVEKVTVKELLKVSKSELPIYRYFAEREVVPPNIGNYYPLLSTHGFRSSRTIAYHKYFDFNPVSEKMDELGVRWWVTDRTLQGLSLIASFGKYFLYERPNTLPIFWIATPGGGHAIPDFQSIKWEPNEVRVKFSTPVVGKLIFAQTYFPGFIAQVDGFPAIVKIHKDLMAIDIPSPSTEVIFRYSPVWWIPSLIIMIVGVCVSLTIFMFCVLNRSKYFTPEQ